MTTPDFWNNVYKGKKVKKCVHDKSVYLPFAAICNHWRSLQKPLAPIYASHKNVSEPVFTPRE